METGSIKWFRFDDNIGFIVPDDPTRQDDVMFTLTSCTRDVDLKTKGARVAFVRRVSTHSGKWFAHVVQPIGHATPSAIESVYTLGDAARRFLGAPWTASSLRTEIAKGRLSAARIAGKLCVTEADIRGMLERCRERPAGHDCTSGSVPTAGDTMSSSTEDASLAQAAARMTLTELKGRSRATSRKSTSPPGAPVISIKSGTST